MPTYEYKCVVCDKKFEYFHKMSENPVINCPECGLEMKRLIGSGSGPIFKGTGFYQTDYKNKSTASAGKGSKPSGPKKD